MKEELSREQKQEFISRLTGELAMLRAKAGFTQEKLANYIGISRQTYYTIETGQKTMAWSTFLSLMYVYDSIPETETVLKKLGIYPDEFLGMLRRGYLRDREAEINKLK